ncbi:hypothetical protein Aperf_G00000121076 [Anoplocephala perfoliata]
MRATEGEGNLHWPLNAVKSLTFESTERRTLGNTYHVVEIVTKSTIIYPSPDFLAASVLGNEESLIDKDGEKRVSEVETRHEDVGFAVAEDEISKKEKEEYSSMLHSDNSEAMEDRIMSASARENLMHKYHDYRKAIKCVCLNAGEESSKTLGEADMNSFDLGEKVIFYFKTHQTSSGTDAKIPSHSNVLTGVQDDSSRVMNGVARRPQSPSRCGRRHRFRGGQILRRIFLSCLSRNAKD